MSDSCSRLGIFLSIIEKHIITKRTDIMKKIVLKNKLYIVKQVKNQPEDK